MNPLLITGSLIVNLALISYSIGIITEMKKKANTQRVMTFLTLGIIFDITATAFMIAGSKNSPFTLHGILGYTALIVMLIDVILFWRLKIKEGMNVPVKPKLNLYSNLAYFWWLISYFTGIILVVMRHTK